MKKLFKGLSMLLAVIVCLSGVQSVSAATKYTKTQDKLSQEIAYYQATYLDHPESFEIKKISKINYTANEEYTETLKRWNCYKTRKTLRWKVEYTERNDAGETANSVMYISSKYVTYYGEISELGEKYVDETDYTKSSVSKSFFKKVKKLTSFYYKGFEEV